MIFHTNFLDAHVLTLIYLFIYNLSLLTFFFLMAQFPNLSQKTLATFSQLKTNKTHLIFISVLLFSMAGVPPFLGFFTKLFILIFLLSTQFVFLFTTLFSLLFLALYFYIQNIRYLHATTNENRNNCKITNIYIQYCYLSLSIVYFISVGFWFFDDLFLFFFWFTNIGE